jgi:uncharacterized protein YdeI (YjbR/CyaY-like superfamily)
MTSRNPLLFKSQKDWRAWLQHNNDKTDEVWLLIYKRRVKKPCITYALALEEAICYGWIDSRVKRIDDEKHIVRFTPRKSGNWSHKNLSTARDMIARGKMTPHGLEWLEGIDLSSVPETGTMNPLEIPKWLEESIRANERAWETFVGLAPTYKRHYVSWITSAKREETRQRRLERALGHLERGEKLPLM